ncbi:hypothetical protein HY768_00965 [candidate division TA06 bacterium]|uniref:Transposase n=1 Tax=candidate division TA06 bacterium TaxID=2250710 RepID=A0A933MH89_UNCT6|nr:hypothetical protein [candidate division TA06 bacterium]
MPNESLTQALMLGLGRFAWQEGYGAFSVCASHIGKVREYINNQEEHHRHKTFREEMDEFLKAYGIEPQRP